MRTRRRFSSIRLGVLFGFLIAILIATAALAAGTFTDDDGNTHEANIEAIAAEGITKGCNPPTNDLYCPSDPVTRGQMAAFLRRAFNLPTAVQDWFIDDDGTTFEGDINALAEAGITKGCNPPRNNQYCPDDPVTRGQMAAFLRRAFDYPSVETNFFADDDGNTFEGDINAIATEGVTKGCNPPTNDRYCPNDLVLRDQMASFLARALGLEPLPPPDPCKDFDSASIFVSTSGDDANDGTCDSPVRTIQRGIDIAPVGGQVVVDSGTYHEVIEIPKNLTLEGLGSGLSVIDGSVGGDEDPVATARLGITVDISGFTVRNGTGGGIETSATLTLEDVEVIGNGSVHDCTAGGIANFEGGTLTARHVEVVGNHCLTNRTAGGIRNEGELILASSLVRGNRSDFDGGGIVTTGTASIVESTISFNETESNAGGGITNAGELLVENSVISDNTVSGQRWGGGILNWDEGQATLTAVHIVRNKSHRQGGGVASMDGTMVIQDSLIANNRAGLDNESSDAEDGGGVAHMGGTLLIEGSAIVDNVAEATRTDGCCAGRGGGIYTLGDITLVNVTISGNSVKNGFALGGGLFVGGQAKGTNVTFGHNSAAEGGNLFVTGGACSITGSCSEPVIDLTNAIVANSESGLDCAVGSGGLGAPDGKIRSLGHNLDSDTSCGFGETGDLSGVNPNLGPLADNGGLTPTHALLSGSPAIDAGDDIAAPAVDQRDISRPQGSASDIGAYELVQ